MTVAKCVYIGTRTVMVTMINLFEHIHSDLSSSSGSGNLTVNFDLNEALYSSANYKFEIDAGFVQRNFEPTQVTF